MKAFKNILADPRGYFESAGRADQNGLHDALQDQGEGTVIRACLWRD